MARMRSLAKATKLMTGFVADLNRTVELLSRLNASLEAEYGRTQAVAAEAALVAAAIESGDPNQWLLLER